MSVDLEALEKRNDGRSGTFWADAKDLIAEVRALRAERDASDARIAQLTAALRAVEWRGPHGYCPSCLADKDEGSGRHAPECIVGKALKP